MRLLKNSFSPLISLEKDWGGETWGQRKNSIPACHLFTNNLPAHVGTSHWCFPFFQLPSSQQRSLSRPRVTNSLSCARLLNPSLLTQKQEWVLWALEHQRCTKKPYLQYWSFFTTGSRFSKHESTPGKKSSSPGSLPLCFTVSSGRPIFSPLPLGDCWYTALTFLQVSMAAHTRLCS